jgi:peptide/nickel transport system substrate-binding protein
MMVCLPISPWFIIDQYIFVIHMEEKMYPKSFKYVFPVLIMLALLMAACTPQTSVTEAAREVEAAETAQTDDVAQPTVTFVPEGPSVGGTLVMVIDTEPDTLDPHKTGSSVTNAVLSLIGASLVAKDTEGNYVPCLAESWEISEDGLTWTFTLKEGVKFHDGNPLTAGDYAWTINRILDPETGATSVTAMVSGVTSAEATDDRTLVIHTSTPSFYLLDNLTQAGYLMPLEEAFVEEMEGDLSRNLVGVGPYIFKEWVTGDRIVLERNPEYNWGPEFTHAGPFYIETIKFRIIPEYSTILAGLEANEIGHAIIQSQDLQRIKDAELYQVFESLATGPTAFIMNNTVAPFDDLKVRQAINYAIDREAIVQVVLQGNGIMAYGALTPSVPEYWSGVEEIGYSYDPEQAAQLLQNAGFTKNADGILEKDGTPFHFTLLAPIDADSVKVAEILQQQLLVVGIDVEIEQAEKSTAIDRLFQGDYEATIMGWSYSNADILYLLYHSSLKQGGGDLSMISDPILDEMLDQTHSVIDIDEHQQLVADIEQRIIENAYMAPIYIQKNFEVVTNSIQGVINSEPTGILLDDAYFVTP